MVEKLKYSGRWGMLSRVKMYLKKINPDPEMLNIKYYINMAQEKLNLDIKKAGSDDPTTIYIVEQLYQDYGKKYNHIPTGYDGRPFTVTFSVEYEPLIEILVNKQNEMLTNKTLNFCDGVNFSIDEIKKYFDKQKE